MKKTIFLFSFCVSAAAVLSPAGVVAQKESFDITSYTPPNNWKKEVTENTISYINVNKNTWCRIGIIKSTISKGSIEQDFETEWQELIVKNYNPTEAPQLNEVQESGGWKIKAGGAKFTFNNADAMAMLTTMSGFSRCVSIIAVTNSQDYIKDIDALLSSVELKKPDVVSQQPPAANDDKNSIIGTWCISASDQSSYRVKNGVVSTIFRQYTFTANGHYTCNIKTFDPLLNSILLGRETGTYQISGTNLTINPQRSVLEEWSKINGGDKWGSLLKTQNIPFEKITYQFTKQYISEINEWQLILKANDQTKRDGPFNNNDGNAWIYIITSPSHPVIKLPNE